MIIFLIVHWDMLSKKKTDYPLYSTGCTAPVALLPYYAASRQVGACWNPSPSCVTAVAAAGAAAAAAAASAHHFL